MRTDSSKRSHERTKIVQSNHTALSWGLKLYTNAISQFVKRRLVGAFVNRKGL